MIISSPELTLGEVFIANRNYLRCVAQKIVRTADLADDVVQDAYLKLAGAAHRPEVQKPLFYCCQVVRNLAIDHFRRHSVEATYRSYGEDVDLLEVPGATEHAQVMGERQLLEQIDQALDTLPKRTRLAFELYRLSGLTQREIGRRLDCSATLVNFMIKDAMAVLEKCRHLLD